QDQIQDRLQLQGRIDRLHHFEQARVVRRSGRRRSPCRGTGSRRLAERNTGAHEDGSRTASRPGRNCPPGGPKKAGVSAGERRKAFPSAGVTIDGLLTTDEGVYL